MESSKTFNLEDWLAKESASAQSQDEQAHQAEHHTGFVAIVGRPNVGKSTLLNALLGQKISITSPKPQTTRHKIHGILNTAHQQIIFVDTPGIHLGESKALNKYMNKAATSALEGVDCVLFIVEAMRWTKEDQNVAHKLKNLDIPVILLINKIDTQANKEALLPFIQKISEGLPLHALIPLSARKRKGIDRLLEELTPLIPQAAPIFPLDLLTDKTERFLAAEIVREKLMRLLGEEVPYGVTVEIETFKDEGHLLDIAALILVEREGQKGIVVGKQGGMLKEIGEKARMDMERLFDQKVFLRLWVKVKGNWSDDTRALASLGYD
jgi:GTP-binding protein Era